MSKLTERLIAFNKRLVPGMVQLKYGLMAENAFRFFRGTCHLFYEDLSRSRVHEDAPLTWICGDLHVENFGSFRANNRMVYFDLNDFDEAMLAPVDWELLRIITSIFVAFDTLKISLAEAREMATLFLTTYSITLSRGKAHSIDPRTAKGIIREFLEAAEERREKELVVKETVLKKGITRIGINNKNHFPVEKQLKRALIDHLSHWIKTTPGWPENYEVADVVFRIAGTGSVGLKRYMFLLRGTRNRQKILFIEMKEGVASSLSPYNTAPQPAWHSEAERIIAVKYRMQHMSPALLSSTFFQENTYVLQEMQPAADKIKFELIRDKSKCIKRVLRDMAILTASAQIRSGGMQGSATIDDLMLFGAGKDWQQPILDYAAGYAKQVKKDYNQFLQKYNAGYFSKQG